jgi:hypothetical protein
MSKLKNTILIIFSFILLSCANLQHSLEKENKFYLSFGDCFNNDTISIYANGFLLFNNKVFKSGFSTGIVPNTYIKYENGYLFAEYENEQKSFKLEINDDLRIRIHINDIDSLFNLSLKKGRIIIINACQSEITVNQYKKKLVFE